MDGDKPKRSRFKAYPLGYFHIDIAQVSTEEGKLHLFVAIDRTSKFAFVQLHENATQRIAAAFLHDLVAAVSIPLCAIGDAVLEVIGLNPQRFDYRSEARWPEQAVFGEEPYYQPTGMGPRVILLHLAARPHVMGGLDQYLALKAHHEAQDVVPYIRLAAGLVGEVAAEVAIRRLSHGEERIAPDGVGRRHEFEVELIVVGRRAGGLFG